MNWPPNIRRNRRLYFNYTHFMHHTAVHVRTGVFIRAQSFWKIQLLMTTSEKFWATTI